MFDPAFVPPANQQAKAPGAGECLAGPGKVALALEIAVS
jgi:hypothetical protein